MMNTTKGADNLRWYLTGAASDGAAQTDPDLSLGKYRSSTEIISLGCEIAQAVDGIKVDFGSGNNDGGVGSIAAIDADTLAYTAPSGTQGSSVEIADGETKCLRDGTDEDKYIRVTRDNVIGLQGSATIDFVEHVNNIFDHVGITESKAGDIEYRCICCRVTGDTPVGNIRIWLDSTVTSVFAIGKEGPSSPSTGSFTDKTVAGEGSAPSGVAFVSPDAIDHADVVNIGGLFPGNIYGLWIRRTIGAAASGSPREMLIINYQAEIVDEDV